MKAMVTGGTGFVGRHLVDVLLARGDEVTALARSPAKATGLAERGVRLVTGDLFDLEAIRAAARDADIVYHVAGLVAARNDAEFLSVNRDGTANVTQAAGEVSRARIVLVSSMAAGGPSARGARMRGTEEPHPVTMYGRSKLAGEDVVRSGKLPWTIVRPPAVYGPGDTEMLRVFKAASMGIAPVFGDGSQELSLVYGPDLAEALAAAGSSAATTGSVYYPCHPEVLTSKSVVEQAGTAAGKPVRVIRLPRWSAAPALAVTSSLARLRGRATILTTDKANEFFAPAWTGDPAPFTSATGWKAQHDFAAGAERTVQWYREQGWL